MSATPSPLPRPTAPQTAEVPPSIAGLCFAASALGALAMSAWLPYCPLRDDASRRLVVHVLVAAIGGIVAAVSLRAPAGNELVTCIVLGSAAGALGMGEVQSVALASRVQLSANLKSMMIAFAMAVTIGVIGGGVLGAIVSRLVVPVAARFRSGAVDATDRALAVLVTWCIVLGATFGWLPVNPVGALGCAALLALGAAIGGVALGRAYRSRSIASVRTLAVGAATVIAVLLAWHPLQVGVRCWRPQLEGNPVCNGVFAGCR